MNNAVQVDAWLDSIPTGIASVRNEEENLNQAILDCAYEFIKNGGTVG